MNMIPRKGFYLNLSLFKVLNEPSNNKYFLWKLDGG